MKCYLHSRLLTKKNLFVLNTKLLICQQETNHYQQIDFCSPKLATDFEATRSQKGSLYDVKDILFSGGGLLVCTLKKELKEIHSKKHRVVVNGRVKLQYISSVGGMHKLSR